jgi:hypothetical protein
MRLEKELLVASNPDRHLLGPRAGWLACAFVLVFQKTVTQKEKFNCMESYSCSCSIDECSLISAHKKLSAICTVT